MRKTKCQHTTVYSKRYRNLDHANAHTRHETENTNVPYLALSYAHATKTITVSSNAMHINFCTKTNKWKKICCYNVHICLVSSSSNGIFGIASNVNKNKTTNELREGNRKLARWNIGRQVVVIENEHWNECLQLIFSGDSGQNSFSVVVKIIHLVTEYWIVAVLSQRPLCSFL